MKTGIESVNRKMVEEERIAICSHFGCGTIKKVKPLKFGFLGFRKYPKCSKHKLSLVFIDEFIEKFISSVNSCLFDISSLPPKDLVNCITKDALEELELFINVWMYCSPIGRGGQIVSRYLDGLSKGYIKLLSRKQRRAIQDGKKSKHSYNMLRQGLKKIAEEYTLFLQELRTRSYDYCDPSKVQPLSKKICGIIKSWRNKQTINDRKIVAKADNPYDISILKKKYDDNLNLRTASLILGKTPTEKISAFELFSAYFEFLKEGLCSKLRKENILQLNIQENNIEFKNELKFNQINFSESISKNFLERFKFCYNQAELVEIYGHLNKQQDWANLFNIPRSTIGYHLTGNRDKFSNKIYEKILIMTNRLLGNKICKKLDTLYKIEERKLEGYRDLNVKKVIQEELDIIITSALVDSREFRVIIPENEVVLIANEPLKGYNSLRKKIINEHLHDIRYMRLLNHSSEIIKNFYNSAENMINNVIKNHRLRKKNKSSQKEIGSYLGIREGYLVKGEPGFELAKKNREKFLYTFILYELKCKLSEFFHLLYIGFTSNMDKRLELHILHSLEPSQKVNRTYKEKVYLQKAISLAIKEEISLIRNKITYIDSIDSIFNNEIQTLNDVYNWLEYRKGNWKYRMLIDFIINNIIMKHFDIDILELHKASHTIRKSEKNYTLNYVHEIGYKEAQETVKGTIWPNGLNSIAGGRGAESYINIPVLDIAAMFTLGFTEIEKITGILKQEYDHINELSATTVGRRIKDVFKSREHALELFLKPVVLKLILDKYNFEFKDILTVLDFSGPGMTQYLKDWFNEKTFRLVRDEKRENKYTIQELEMKYEEPLIQWISWALNGTNQNTISKKVGVSRSTIYEIYKKISSILFSEGNLSYEQFKKLIRRKIATRLLKIGFGHKQIVEETFEMSETNAVRIFEDCFDMPFNEIMDKYYKKS
ncbi:MAG: hypothetical protein E3J90_03455 [Promethearchaeota archaeon]|nr:MAG: hypothetical protein E3J90_03455 [Candidatus Lokiarchaeota archaeon]